MTELTWGELTIGNPGVTWWNPSTGTICVLPPGATTKPPPPKTPVKFIGGVLDGMTVPLSSTPPRVLIGRALYSRLDDPDTGEFLGGYALVSP